MTDALTSLDEARRALQDSEGRLQQVLDNTSALVFAKDRLGRYLFVNREFERITGRTSAQVLGRTDDNVFPSDVAARFRHNDLLVLRDGRATEFEEVADFGAGTRTFLASKFPLLDADGEPYAVCGIATDITERRQAVEALRESEAQYRSIFNASEDALVLFDSKLRRVDVNPAFERMYGWSRDEVLGRTYAEAAPQEDGVPGRQDNLRRALAGETCRCELDAVRKDGERIRIEMITVPFRLRGEQHVLAIGRDVTERKRLEDAFSSAALAVSQSEGEALFRELARYLATTLDVDAVFIATRDEATPAQMNVRAFHLDGATLENFSYELAGTPCEVVLENGFQHYPCRLSELFPLDADFAKLGFQGYAGYPLVDSRGRVVGLLAVVTRRALGPPAFVESVLRIFAVRVNAELERVVAKQALRASQDSYREIFEASEDAIFVHDWDTGAILDANPQACASYGYSRDEFRNLRLGEISSGVPPYTEEQGVRWINRAKAEGSVRFEWHRRSRDGSLHWDEVRLKAARIGGQPRVLAFTRDITEAKLAESERQELEARLRQAQRMEAIGQLTGGIAHDFNNLLTSIMGYVTLAAERDAALGDRRLSGYLAQARSSCERARDLIQQMLMFSRGQRGAPITLDLASLVEESLDRLRPMLPAKVQVTSNLDGAVPRVRTDPLQVEQVLLNLCINARDAVGESGRVEVAVRSLADPHLVCSSCRSGVAGSFVEMVVADTGHGIPPNVLERIFEPFFSTKEIGKGTGMGLAMVHGIVHEHGGHVVVESQPGRGSRFRVMWPALSSADEQATAPSAAPVHRDRAPPPRLQGAALIVDDEAAVGEFMRELLGTWGLEATFVSSPLAAIELLGEEPGRFDVVVTDQTMPRMTGLELARAIRDRRATLPVVLYTGYGQGIAPADLQSAGIRAVLGKPIDPAALEEVLGGILGRR